MPPRQYRHRILIIALMLSGISGPLWAQPEAAAAPLNAQATDEEVVNYPAAFFQRYQPNTALDMVRQVPGFQLDDGGSLRGFGVAAGNILINGRRPSAKQDLPSAILDRIPASHVSRIELIRGQIRGIDLRDQTVVANILLSADAPAAVRFESFVRKNLDYPLLKLFASASLSDRWAGVDYNVGVDFERDGTHYDAVERNLDADRNLVDERTEASTTPGREGRGYINASRWFGDTLVAFNTRFGYEGEEPYLTSRIRPQPPGSGPARTEEFGEDFDLFFGEVGADAERFLSDDLLGKAILLYSYENLTTVDTQRNLDAQDERTLLRIADTGTDTTEAIARLEFDWAGWEDHAVQFNIEGAFNALDGTLVRTDNTGAGPVTVDVPGANTRVEESRGEALLKDTWTVGHWVLDYGVGAEVSEIRQTGDAELERRFFFLKPQTLVTWSPNQRDQTRMRLAREVAQLDFNDFVSATVFQDDDLALGNPDLEPERTWVAEVSHERRFGDLGVVTLTAFYHWITEVQDLLPITDEFEAPGNLGDGRRWGLELQGTLPLEWLGLSGARLDARTRWQDSSVTDPVTGEDRQLSAEGAFAETLPGLPFDIGNDWAYNVNFRQDFEGARVAWGWEVWNRSERPLYKVNELDIYSDGTVISTFVETTRWWDLKIRLTLQNMLNYDASRERRIYTGLRDRTPIERYQLRDETEGTHLILSVSGGF